MNKIVNGNPTPSSAHNDKNKDWQLEMLMEKLRSKASQYKSLQEISKTVRMTMLDKRFSLDSVEKIQHQKCLDTLQHCIKVTSLQSMVERLESLTRQLGLKLMVGPSGVELFISSDMFYLEINLEQSGAVRDVKVHHEGKNEQQSCAELVSCLSRQDFADFTAQLEGFASIYQLNAEKKIKSKAFTVLQSLEADLNTLAQLQTFMKEPFNLLHKSPVGILEKRRGGHPMKLTYFVSPYDLIDKEKGDLEAMTIEAVTSKNLGYSVTVCMEGSAAHKLQTTTVITVNRNVNGKSTPSYAQLTSHNSAVIPACFVLRLNKPMPMCVALVRQIQQLTELECGETSTTHPLISLIVSHVSEGKLDSGNNKGLFVTLPDQHHCYFMTENKSMEGMMIHSIPFTHPSDVCQILVILRQQALFNTLIMSCVRSNNKQDFDSMIMFEISALSWTHISVSLEHPIEETMATAELDLSDISNLQCHVPSSDSCLPHDILDPTSEFATKVLNRSFSIPVTMRSIIKIWDKQATRNTHYNGHENFNLPLGSGDPGGHKGGSSNSGSGLGDFGSGLDVGKGKPDSSNSHHNLAPLMSSSSHSHPGMFLNDSVLANAANFSNFPTNPNEPPMISNIELANILSGHSEKPTVTSGKHLQKRRTSEDLWKSMKQQRKVDDSEILMETSSNDSTSRSTPLSSHEAPSEISITTPTSMVGFQSDLELSALDPTELIGASSDKALSEFDNIDDELGDVEEMLAVANNKIRKRELHKPPMSSSLIDLGDKGLVPPSVSITPINPPPSFNQSGNSMTIERRPGIEIIPIATTPPASLPSSITITPLSSSQMKSNEERNRDKKSSSKNRSDDKNRPEKKRKRKRDESPMGPPDKIPSSSSKQDPLSKPVSVSIIKPSESPPLTTSGPASPSSLMRKFNASPTPTKNFTVSGKLSPSLNMKGALKASSSSSSVAHQSPKHSPAHATSSPKHGLISSPKNHGTSPKHPSTSGSSGKPSLSTLKSAASSPSSKSSSSCGEGGGSIKNKSGSKDSSRDKSEKRSSSFGSTNSNKVKSSVKLKQLDMGGSSTYNSGTSSDLQQVNQIDNLPSPTATSSGDFSKCNNPAQVRNRKGSLSAIVDKLKSAQHCDGATDLSSKSSSNRSERSGGGSQTSASSKSADGSSGKTSISGSSKTSSSSSTEAKNSEYMVKPSLDGMKITINKTRTKDSSKMLKSQSGGSSGTGSPKTHTGLKPGVNSGPASKKPQQLSQQKSSSSPNISSGAGTGTTSSTNLSSSSFSSNFKVNKSLASKGLSSSSSKSLTKFSNSPKSGITDLSRISSKDKPRFNKSNSEKSIFSGSRDRKGSPTQNRAGEDLESSSGSSDKAALKMAFSKMDPYGTPPIISEVLMKQLDKKFQIPKLSARNSEDKKSSSTTTTPNNKLPTTNSVAETVNSMSRPSMEGSGAKMYCNDVSLPKYPLPLPTSKMFDSNIESKIRMSMISGASNAAVGSNSSPKHNDYGGPENLESDRKKDILPQNLSTGNPLLMSGKEDAYKQQLNFGTSVNSAAMSSVSSSGKSTFSCNSIASDLSVKSVDLSVNKFAVSSSVGGVDKGKDLSKMYHPKDMHVSSDGLLDFSASSVNKTDSKSIVNSMSAKDMCGGLGQSTMTSSSGSSYPPSSSVSVHIVKSPDPSPHSASPCITDDELMDEALIGLGK